jgi:cholesterol transport system auxiliary component
MRPRTPRTTLITLAFATLLASCSFSLRSTAPPVQSYVLRAADSPPQPAREAPGGASLRVLSPTSAPGLGSEQIMLLQSDRRLSYYAASRWAAALPSMVEQLAVDTLRRTGAWGAVEDSSGILPAEYFLQLDIRRFEADYTGGSGPPVVQVVLDCTLGHRGAEQELVASFRVARAVHADENRLGAVVAAFEQAADAALGEVAERARAAIARKAP